MYGGMSGEGVGGLDLNLGIHCFILFGSERNLQSVPSILKGIYIVHSILSDLKGIYIFNSLRSQDSTFNSIRPL